MVVISGGLKGGSFPVWAYDMVSNTYRLFETRQLIASEEHFWWQNSKWQYMITHDNK